MFVKSPQQSRSRGHAPAANARRGDTRGRDAITRSTRCRSIRDKGGKPVKIKGRFIAVLAAVGLLAALLPALPTGAVAGVVTLSGGEKGQYFSDNTGENVVTIHVEDEDLSPVREGTARYPTHAASSNFDLKLAYVQGEQQKVENKLRLSNAVLGETGGTPHWTFTLEGLARDTRKSKDGDLTAADVSVVVDGQTLTAPGGYTVHRLAPSTANPGGGIKEVTVYTKPRDVEGSVVITYEITEYMFSSDTPLRLAGTEIRYGPGPGFQSATNQIQVSQANSSDAQVTTTAQTPAGNAAVVTFVYHVTDSEKDYVSVSTNTSLATGVDRKLNGSETTASTSLFESSIAIVESSNFTQITNQAGNTNNNADGLGKVQIGELNATEMLGGTLQTRLEGLATSFGLSAASDAEKLLPYLIPATHGDTLTVTYADANPAANLAKTATIDLEAPEVTLIGPSHKLFTRTNVVTLRASVVDTGAGVAPGAIDITSSFPKGSSISPAPIQDGYQITNVPNAVGEGKHSWAVTVVDKVGNTPTVDDTATTDTNEGALGAAAPLTAAADNPFVFTVDISGPTLISGKTGLYLKNAGVTSGDKQEIEAGDNREWLRAVFGLGDGTAPLDPATVSATDFTVGGATPLEAVVNAKAQGAQKAGSVVYLKVGQLDTNARPDVRLVGEVRDKAGNPRTDGTVTNVVDGLAPVLTVTPSAEIANKSVTITVTSSERLGLNPIVERTTSKPVKGDDPESPVSLPVSLNTGALTTWTATYTNPSGDASIQYVVASASDQAGNEAKIGVAANDKDIISFQVDDADPGLLFKDAEGSDLEDTKQQEGAVWIVAEFDDDEYPGDKYRKISLDSVSLKDSSGNVITSDTGDLFGLNDEKCDAHGDTSDAPAANKCATYTLAIDLAPGDYNIAVAGTDAAGNSVSDDVDFEVTAREPFELDLKPGVNLISIPGSPVGDSGNLNILFEDEPVDLVTTYDRSMDLAGENPWLRSTRDPETGLFTGDISTLQPGAAYFVTADARATVNITLRSVVGELPPTMMVRFGYNALGFSSIAPTAAPQPIDDYLNSIPWTVAYSYDPTPGKGWEVLRPGSSEDDSEGAVVLMVEPGRGYLVFSRFDATLTP